MIQNQWYAVLPSRAVKHSDAGLVAVRRLNKDLVFFRDTTGVIGCLEDQCSHRGAALSAGKIVGNCVQCPFHAIEFALDGKCTFIPANGKSSTNPDDLKRYNVRAYAVREAHGIIYLWHGQGEPTTSDLPFFSDYIDSDTIYSEIEDHWQAHYSRAIENQLDVVHVPFVHHNTIGRGHKTLINGPKVLFENDTLITSANNVHDEGQKPLPPAECVIKSTFLAFRYPNIWMNHISDKIRVVIYFAPVDDENTILYIRFYCRLYKVSAFNHAMAYFGKFANKIIESQDKRVVITQKPKASQLKSGEKLLVGDGPIVKYRTLRQQYIDLANSKV